MIRLRLICSRVRVLGVVEGSILVFPCVDTEQVWIDLVLFVLLRWLLLGCLLVILVCTGLPWSLLLLLGRLIGNSSWLQLTERGPVLLHLQRPRLRLAVRRSRFLLFELLCWHRTAILSIHSLLARRRSTRYWRLGCLSCINVAVLIVNASPLS